MLRDAKESAKEVYDFPTLPTFISFNSDDILRSNEQKLNYIALFLPISDENQALK